MKTLIFFVALIIYGITGSATNYTWNGTSTNWADPANWSPAGIPVATDSIIIINAAAQPQLDMSRSAGQFTINSGTLDLNGFILTVTGSATYISGFINNGIITSTGNTTTFSGTVFDAVVNATSTSLFLNGGIFNNTVSLTKNGAIGIVCAGGNTFNSTVAITNSGSANLVLASSSPDIFNGNVTFVNSGNAELHVAYNSTGNLFNGNISLSNTSGGIYFGGPGGTSILAVSKVITIGATGFSAGILSFAGFSQTGTTAQALSLTGTACLQLGTSTFGGNVNFVSPQVYLNSCTFNGTAFIQKTGGTGNTSAGGNVFNGITTLTNTGSGVFELGNTIPEYFGNNLTINNSGTSRIQIGINSAGNVFHGNVTINHGGNTSGINTIIARNAGCTATINGNLILNCTNASSGSGIIIANDAAVTVNGNIIVSSTNGRGVLFGAASGSVTLGAGFTISDGGAGTFTAGTLTLNRFVETGGAAQNLALTGTANIIVGTGTTFNSAVTFSAPQLFLNGAHFNSTASLTKNGATDNSSTGNNIFNGTTTITNSGSGFLHLANASADDFNADVSFSKSGAGSLEPAYGANSTFSGNVTVSSATPVVFGAGGGTAIFDGGNAQTISKTGSANPLFYKMRINKSANNVSLNTEINIATLLTFSLQKIISTSTCMLVFTDNAAYSGASNSSYADGPVRKTGDDAFTFPVGKNGYYHPVSISAPALATDGFTAEYIAANPAIVYSNITDPSLNHISACEYWMLNRSNGNSDVAVTLSWNTNSCGVTVLADLRASHWDGTMWKDHGNGSTTGTTTSGTVISAAAVTGFGPFTLASSGISNPLPIELLNFSAHTENEAVEIDWATATETNNDYFVVERTADGIHFETVNTITGSGNSSSTLHYSAIDKNSYPGVSYYRLKQVDFDGRYDYSDMIEINFKSGPNFSFNAYPNPVQDHVNLSFTGISKAEKVMIFIHDIKGNECFSNIMTADDLNKTITLHPEDLTPGAYFISCISGQSTCRQKLIVN